MLQRAPCPYSRGVFPLRDPHALAFEFTWGIDRGLTINVDVGQAKFSVGKRGDRNMRPVPGMGANPRSKAAVPGISVVFPLDDFNLETFNLDASLGNGHVRIYRRLAEIESELGIGHGLISLPKKPPDGTTGADVKPTIRKKMGRFLAQAGFNPLDLKSSRLFFHVEA